MIISDKNHESNRRNAQRSTGPTTPEGKKAASLNAVTYGLRARSLLINSDDPADYQQPWDGLEAEWQLQTHTERYYLEQMSTSQWLLTRMASTESRVSEAGLPLGRELELLDRVGVQRLRLERSFTSAMRELKQLHKERHAQLQPQPTQPAQAAKAAQPPVHKPAGPPAPRLSDVGPRREPSGLLLPRHPR